MKRDARNVIPCQSPEAAPLVTVFSFKDGEITRRRFAKGESPNSPVDCLGRGNALQRKIPLSKKTKSNRIGTKADTYKYVGISLLNIFRLNYLKIYDKIYVPKNLGGGITMKEKRKMAVICIIVLAFITFGYAIAFIVHIEADKRVSQITADGMLEYIVGFLSFGATMLLSIYALYQTNHSNDMAKKANEITEKANAIAERAYDIEKYNYQLQIRPFITVTDYDISVFSKQDILFSDLKVFYEAGNWDSISNTNGIKFRITNTTNSFLSFSFDEAICKNSNNKWNNSCAGEKNIKNRIINLMAGESKEIVFIADDKMLEKLWAERISMSFILENRFMQRFKETFDIVFMWIKKGDDLSWKCFLNFQNFRIFRFEYHGDNCIEVEEDL